MNTSLILTRAYAPGKIPARDWVFEVTDSLGTGFDVIGGLTTFSPSSTKNDTDGTNFDSEGVLEHWTMSRGSSITLEGQRYEDSADGARDAGQERCEEVALLVGSASLVIFQVTSPGGTVYSFEASADVNPFGTEGGGNDDFAGWRCALNISGAVTVT